MSNHGRKPRLTTKWLRRHSASMKPTKKFRFSSSDGTVYWVLSTGQMVHEMTARRNGYATTRV